MLPGSIEPIQTNVSDEELKRNIDRYRAEATKLGATDARALETSVIPIDDRVVLKCRLSLRARPSMEAVGVNCFRLATELGRQIYPIGSDAKADSIPFGTLMGLVLVD